jgi:hypothetical protein
VLKDDHIHTCVYTDLDCSTNDNLVYNCVCVHTQTVLLTITISIHAGVPGLCN